MSFAGWAGLAWANDGENNGGESSEDDDESKMDETIGVKTKSS